MIERLIDQAARETGRDPLALRQQNLIPVDAMPYQTALTFNYDSGDFPKIVASAAKMQITLDLLSDAKCLKNAACCAALELQTLLRWRVAP